MAPELRASRLQNIIFSVLSSRMPARSDSAAAPNARRSQTSCGAGADFSSFRTTPICIRTCPVAAILGRRACMQSSSGCLELGLMSRNFAVYPMELDLMALSYDVSSLSRTLSTVRAKWMYGVFNNPQFLVEKWKLSSIMRNIRKSAARSWTDCTSKWSFRLQLKTVSFSFAYVNYTITLVSHAAGELSFAWINVALCAKIHYSKTNAVNLPRLHGNLRSVFVIDWSRPTINQSITRIRITYCVRWRKWLYAMHIV